MARIRTIKPEFWSSKTLARVSRESRLLFIGLWNLADDHGVLLDSPKTIAGELFPWDDEVDAKFVTEKLQELEDVGVIVSGSQNGKDYIIIRSWKEHQKIDHPAKTRTISEDQIENILGRSRDTRETLATVSSDTRARNREEGRGIQESKNLSDSSLRSESSSTPSARSKLNSNGSARPRGHKIPTPDEIIFDPGDTDKNKFFGYSKSRMFHDYGIPEKQLGGLCAEIWRLWNEDLECCMTLVSNAHDKTDPLTYLRGAIHRRKTELNGSISSDNF